MHFSSIEIIKIESDSYTSNSKNPERTFIELNNLRYLGLAGARGIYVSTVNTILEILKVEGESNNKVFQSMTSLDSL